VVVIDASRFKTVQIVYGSYVLFVVAWVSLELEIDEARRDVDFLILLDL
jgi:hypothetical protein